MMPDRLDDVTFSRSRRAAYQNPTAFPEKLARRQVVDLFSLDRAVEIPIKILKALLVTEAGSLRASGDEAVLANRQLVLENQLQELVIVEPSALGLMDSYLQGF